jgi:hypothetical protein
MSEDKELNPEQIVKIIAELSTVTELVKRLGDLRTELHQLLTRRYSICREQGNIDKLFYTMILYLNSAEYVKEVSVSEGNIMMTNSRFTAVEFEPNKVSLRDKNGIAVRTFNLCNMSTADVIELFINAGKAIETVKSELEPLIKRFEKFIDAVKTVVATLEMVGKKT